MKRLSDSARNEMRKHMFEARGQIEKSIDAIHKGRPLDAEDAEDRKIARVQSLLPDLDIALIKRVVNYDESVLSIIPAEKKPLVESLWGRDQDKDYVDIAYLEIAQAAAKSVGRIVSKGDFSPQGTGFMISDRLLMTNWHVIDDAITAEHNLIEFDYELNPFGFPRRVTRFEFEPEVFFFGNEADESSFEDELDFAMIAVKANPEEIGRFGFCPLNDSGNKHAKGDFATLIQHPLGGLKQIALRENRIVARLDNPPLLHYMSATAHGSSGSPVFDDQWRVIGLHHGEWPSVDVYPGGAPVPQWIKEATRTSGIIKYVDSYLASHPEKYNDGQRRLVHEALHCRFSTPSLIERRREEFLV
jgi:endonuclease G, mitochondrial